MVVDMIMCRFMMKLSLVKRIEVPLENTAAQKNRQQF